jgi:WD40 repeat protein
LIENAHNQLVRDIDFNPNKPYILVSSGDDGKTKFWDVRKPTECLKILNDHSHWYVHHVFIIFKIGYLIYQYLIISRVWGVRYNPFHDQLLLTCSSDNRVVLNSIPSISSEPYKTSVLESQGEEQQQSGGYSAENRVTQVDKLVKVYEDHEDSVYAVEWSVADPWIFASLSYDGRLVINKVPREEKYNILL